MKQGTPEWYAARLGHCTASHFAEVLSHGKTTKEESTGRRNYRVQLVTERMTGVPMEDAYRNKAMEWGLEHEPFARIAYEARTGNTVDEVGFIKHASIEWVGCSPDGIVSNCASGDGGIGGLQIKCPHVSAIHVETILAGAVPREHYAQVQGEMWVTGADWWDFVSYDPRMPQHRQAWIRRVPRDEVYIKLLRTEVEKFLAEVDELVTKLMREG